MEKTNWKTDRIKLKKMIEELDGRIIIAIGVANGAEARQLHHTIYELYDQNAVPDYIGGFVTYISGYLCSATYGLPDLGYILRSEIVRQTDIIEHATWMAALDTGKPAFPIGVDADTGFGNEPSSIILTCRQIQKQGGQYIQLEDQYGINKSCGHMAGASGTGKQVVSAEEMIEKRIKPAVSYASSQDDFLIMARTDTIASHGFDEALKRGWMYVEAGAHLLFVEAPESLDMLETVAREFEDSPALVLANMIEGSPMTPYLSPEELHQMGFDIGLYCVGSLLAGRAAQSRYFSILGRGENVMLRAESSPTRWFDGFNRVIGREQTEMWNRFFSSDI